MFLLNEILNSSDFEKELPKEMKFTIRRVLREKQRKQNQQSQPDKKTEFEKVA